MASSVVCCILVLVSVVHCAQYDESAGSTERKVCGTHARAMHSLQVAVILGVVRSKCFSLSQTGDSSA